MNENKTYPICMVCGAQLETFGQLESHMKANHAKKSTIQNMNVVDKDQQVAIANLEARIQELEAENKSAVVELKEELQNKVEAMKAVIELNTGLKEELKNLEELNTGLKEEIKKLEKSSKAKVLP